MKALVLEGYNNLAYRDVPDPVITDNEVLVKVMACSICGSDVHGMDGSTGRRIPPIIMGHEASGIIAATGKSVVNWKTGDRVTFDSTVYRLDDWYTLRGFYNLSDNREVLGVSPGTYRRHGAFAEYVSVPQHILYHIADNVTFEQAAMVEAVAVALHALNLSRLSQGDVCMLTGAGKIGIFLVKLLKISGAGKIIVADINKKSLENAIASGAGFAFTSDDKDLKMKVLELTSGRGADISYEAVGKSESVNQAIDLVRKGGKVVIIGNTSSSVDLPLQKVVTGELQILGSCAIRGEYEVVLDLISSGKITVDDQISAIAPLSEGALWFSRLYSNSQDLKKVILVP